NDRFIPSDFQYHLGWAFADGYRGNRIRHLLASSSQISYEDMQQIQYDHYSLAAAEYLPLILDSVHATSGEIIQLQDILKEWDLFYEKNSTGATISSVWIEEFLKATISDQIPEEIFDNLPIKGKLVSNLLNLKENNIWFDDITTIEKESKSDMIKDAFDNTWSFLTNKFGNEYETWVWGRLHKVQFSHILGSALDIFNAGGLTSAPGGLYTINPGSYNSKFIQNQGSSMRQIMGLDNTNTIFVIVPPGQSGVFFNINYGNQVQNWIHGEYFLVPVNFSSNKTSFKRVNNG
ncbi:MAG: penicillin acylase family protein, partial [Candidatus Hodarchaeales archaeon]